MSEHRESDYEQGVMVDVGPGFGALVIQTAEAMRGQEIEISPLGDDGARTHTDVLRRTSGAGATFAAVFGSLPEGDYRLWPPGDAAPIAVHVPGGRITELDWR